MSDDEQLIIDLAHVTIARLTKERDAARREICEFRLGSRHEVEAWRRGWDCYEHRNLVGKGKA